MFKQSIIGRLLFCTVVSLPVPAFALSTISISSPACDGNYLVQGDFQGVAGVEFHVAYDPSTLSSPVVSKGTLAAGMTFGDANAGLNPIRVLWTNSSNVVTARGTVASIRFNKVGAAAGVITGLTATIVDLAANKLPLTVIPPVNCSNPGNDNGGVTSGSGNQPGSGDGGGSGTTTPPTTTTTKPSTPATVTTPTTTATTVPTYMPYVVGGTVTLPSAEQGTDSRQAAPQPAPQPAPQDSGERTVPQAPAPRYQTTEEAPVPKAVEEPAPAPKRVSSVLERFQLFTGEKTVKNLTALFDRDGDAAFSQTPAIVIADGKSTAKVSIKKVRGDKAPNFAFTSARYVSLARSADGGWDVEVLPEKDAVSASVTMLINGTMQEIPLAVSPKAAIAKGGQPTEADFQLFLKERGTPAAPKYDLNGDGKRDYIDDYIFTANYLVKSDKQSGQQKK